MKTALKWTVFTLKLNNSNPIKGLHCLAVDVCASTPCVPALATARSSSQHLLTKGSWQHLPKLKVEGIWERKWDPQIYLKSRS